MLLNLQYVVYISWILDYPFNVLRNPLFNRYFSLFLNVDFLFINSFNWNFNLFDNWNFHNPLNRFFSIDICDYLTFNDFFNGLLHVDIIGDLHLPIHRNGLFDYHFNYLINIDLLNVCLFGIDSDLLINSRLS